MNDFTWFVFAVGVLYYLRQIAEKGQPPRPPIVWGFWRSFLLTVMIVGTLVTAAIIFRSISTGHDPLGQMIGGGDSRR